MLLRTVAFYFAGCVLLPSNGLKSATLQRPAIQPSQQEIDRSAGALLDSWMGDFDHGALDAARSSGRSFPEYNRWLGLVASAIASGMNPAQLQPADPLSPLGGAAGKLVTASMAAETEMNDFLPALPGGRDLGKIAAFKQRTRPTSLTRVLLTVFQAQQSSIRSAAASQVSARYGLPK